MNEIFNICESYVSRDAFRARCHTLCLDGTSSTGKTTILRRTGLPISKVQRSFNAVNVNTYFPSMIGYIAAGINASNTGQRRINDRSFLNPLEWRVLWRVMDHWLRNYGNRMPDLNDASMSAALKSYVGVFERLRGSYYYANLRRRFNVVALIDTNVERCDERRRRRNSGSDGERSNWMFYTYLQNLMYQTLYPMQHIDVAWFDVFDENIVAFGIAEWLKFKVAMLDQGPSVDRHLRLPVAMRSPDLLLANDTTHLYRARGRLYAKAVARNEPAAATVYPSYLNVDEEHVAHAPIACFNASTMLAAAAAVARHHSGGGGGGGPIDEMASFDDDSMFAAAVAMM